MMTPLIRNPVARARLQGMFGGMVLTLAFLWIAQPIVTGRWYLL